VRRTILVDPAPRPAARGDDAVRDISRHVTP
jgi:hypothetical protein